MRTSCLHNAKSVKADEYYTLMEDIEDELGNYNFDGAVIYCNCDNPFESNFYKYFKYNYDILGLGGLYATCYKEGGIGYKAYYDGRTEIIEELQGDGDFRSAECIELLKACDMVVTNPPFSLFREFIDTLLKYHKKFLIIGPFLAVSYKNILNYISDNLIWYGYTASKNKKFKVPDTYNHSHYDAEGNKLKAITITWYTNLPVDKQVPKLELCNKYNAEYYP